MGLKQTIFSGIININLYNLLQKFIIFTFKNYPINCVQSIVRIDENFISFGKAEDRTSKSIKSSLVKTYLDDLVGTLNSDWVYLKELLHLRWRKLIKSEENQLVNKK